MEEKWYFVQAGERKGPIDKAAMMSLIAAGTLGAEDYVWMKGFESWTKLKEVSELQSAPKVEPKPVVAEPEPIAEPVSSEPEPIVETSNSLKDLAGDGNSVFIKIGADRGASEVEYGPYSLEVISRLYSENRMNAKTFIFVQGMQNWQILADFDDFEELFEGAPPPIKDEDRRANKRKPFIARMYIQNRKDVFIGICRDISVGGMQVLVDNFPGDVGERISINVHPENTDHHFVAAGKIVRLLDGGQGFSFRFLELDSESTSAIKNYLSHE